MKVVFFGTPDFSAEILRYLVEQQIEIVAVVTMPDKPVGRSYKLEPSPVKKYLQLQNLPIPLFQPINLRDEIFVANIRSLQADVFIVAAFGYIFPESFLNIPRYGCINVHTSLLPRYRGAAPIQRAIMNGDQETGVSIMYMVKALDAGDVLYQEKVAILPDMHADALENILCDIGKKALLHVLKLIETESVVPQKQDANLVTYAKKIEKEDAFIGWQDSAVAIYNLYRGVTPKPGAWTLMNIRGITQRVKLLQLSIENSNTSIQPGFIEKYSKHDGFVVGCMQGTISIHQLQIAGKKPQTANEFISGYRQDEIQLCLECSDL